MDFIDSDWWEKVHPLSRFAGPASG